MLTMRSHVERCPTCSAELESLKQLKSNLSALPLCEPREEFAEDILRQVRMSEPSAPASRLSWGLTIATSVAAATLALLAFNAFFGASPEVQVAEDGTEFDYSSDHFITSPDVGGTAPLIPVSR